jgi:hypothetical protein
MTRFAHPSVSAQRISKYGITTRLKRRHEAIPNAPARAVADEAEGARDEPRRAEAAPARRNEKPHRESANTGAARHLGNRTGRNPAAALKAAFRQVVKAITRREEHEPKPQTRRRRGESDRALRMTARATLRRAPRLPPQAYAAASMYLADTLDWLNLWQEGDDSDPNSNLDVCRNDLSLRL